MFVHAPMDIHLPSVVSTNHNEQRYYKSPTSGLWYPSVTTVTGFSKKSFFTEWRKDPVNEKICTDAQVRGEALHLMFENYLKNKPDFMVGQPAAYVKLFEQLRPRLDKISNVRLQEQALWSDKFRIAGRFDCIADYNGELSIIDFKGSGKAKKKYQITNYFEQACVYAVMFQERTGIKIKKFAILVTAEDGSSQEFVDDVSKYIPSLAQTMKNFWKHHDLDAIQSNLKDHPIGDSNNATSRSPTDNP